MGLSAGKTLVVALLCCAAPAAMAGAVLQPTSAPDWEISTWLNDGLGSLHDQRGRVVLVGFFQLRCPVSNSFSIPLFRRWSELYGDREDVLIVSVHSVFEGHGSQSPQHLREFVRENGISYAVGIDAYDDSNHDVPVTMRRYGARGTPHLAIVDKQGMLRFTHFGTFDPVPVEAFIERLLRELPRTPATMSTTAPRSAWSRPAAGERLSGTYRFQVGEATGLCATWIPESEISAEMRVYRDAIDVEFFQPLLGIRELELAYDADSGRVEGEVDPLADAKSGIFRRGMRFTGVLDGQGDPPELEFELSVMDGKCTIPGGGRREP